jgi:hypothetical protein
MPTPMHVALPAARTQRARKRWHLAGPAVAVLIAGCASQLPRYEARALPPSEQAALNTQVRGYAKTYCGSCHLASQPTANPKALAIYNLDRDDWATMLTEQRLRNGFPRRLTARLDADGRQQLRRFIEAELALRSAAR